MSTRLLDEMRDLMRRRHYSIHTERAYRDWVRRYIRFHNMQSKDDVRHGEEKIEAFLTYLARGRQVATSAQNQVMNALIFLYKHVLEQPLSGVVNADRARRQPWIPVVLTREETARVITLMSRVHQLIHGVRAHSTTSPSSADSLSPSIVFSRLASGRPWRIDPWPAV